ncbi:MAG TPA: DapH/DapD/GlmU-related protein [Thermoleophilaceae bacterium]|nr:DapH/DapD/GlmU-related protein [Thermoleophilaceae bacterium]
MPSQFERLDPRAFRLQRTDSAWWHWLVNGVAASPALSRERRRHLLRLGGLEVENAIVEGGCYFFSSDIAIRDHAMINHRVYFDTRAHIELAEGAGVATDAMIYTSTHDLGPEHKRWGAYRTAPVTIGPGAWIGLRALVLPGVTVGAGAIVGAGAVVTGDVEPNCLYAGVPARKIREL